MALSSSSAATNVFEIGNYETDLIKIEEGTCSNATAKSPPKPLLIATPSEAQGGVFPILIYLHGFLLCNSFYSQLIQHIASHGFIVIAPQLVPEVKNFWNLVNALAGADSTEEINSTVAITNWLSNGLQNLLPSNVHPNLDKLGLAGHSRGGKVAFALGLQKSSTLKFRALIGVDPVDGMDKGKQTLPPVLTYERQSFDLHMPVLVIGSGLGEIKKFSVFPAAAPKGVSHEDFYKKCDKPAFYFVAKDYGHIDMLDDNTGFTGKIADFVCENGKSREPMRRFVGGIIVAFLKRCWEDDSSHLQAIKDHREIAPVKLQKVDFRV